MIEHSPVCVLFACSGGRCGPDIPLSVNGNETTGDGMVLFGIGGHRLRLRVTLDQMEMDGSNDQGGLVRLDVYTNQVLMKNANRLGTI